jgi:hypothetical protein
VNNPNINLHTLPLKYPEILNTVPKSIIEKLNYKSAEAKLKLTTAGSIYDRTLFWGDDYVSLVDDIISKHHIELVVATIAPLNLAYQIIPLKSKHSRVSFVADFRDPWTMSSAYGFPQSNPTRQLEEERKEAEVCKHFDIIVAPNDHILQDLSTLHRIPMQKFYKLIHAVDADDYKLCQEQIQKPAEPTVRKVAIVGTMYENSQQEFDDLFRASNKFQDVEFHFFASNIKHEYLRNAEATKIHFHDPLKPKNLFKELRSFDYLFIIYNANMPNLMYTKIVEFICVKVPVIIIGKEGEASKFLTKNGMGLSIDNKKIAEGVTSIFNTRLEVSQDFDCTSFKFEQVTAAFIDRVKATELATLQSSEAALHQS